MNCEMPLGDISFLIGNSAIFSTRGGKAGTQHFDCNERSKFFDGKTRERRNTSGDTPRNAGWAGAKKTCQEPNRASYAQGRMREFYFA